MEHIGSIIPIRTDKLIFVIILLCLTTEISLAFQKEPILVPSLPSQGAQLVSCVCLNSGSQEPNSIIVPNGSLLTNRAFRVQAPFIVQPQGGIQCKYMCNAMVAGGGVCVSGPAEISSYRPDFPSTNSGYPGLTKLDVNITKITDSSCH
jgi:hypothetical protein